MATLHDSRRDLCACRLLFLAATVCVGLACCGCAGFWDEVTSRDFEFKELYSHPNPLVVLRDSNDGDKRASALRALQEPKRNGGTDQEQDTIIRVLTAAATTERQPLCRLAAIETLGKFKDPRATQALKDAFYNAGTFPRDPHSGPTIVDGIYSSSGGPPPEMITRIQCQALTALGQTGNPAAIELLVRVVKEPRGEGDQENQQAMDRRIAATKALGNFKSRDVQLALVSILEKEKDVALRDRANESLQASTGQKLPPDAKAWTAMLNAQPDPGTQRAERSSKPGFLQAVFK